MDLHEIVNSSIESLKTNRLRSILTSLGIIIGVSAIILLISIGAGLQGYISKQFEKLGSNSIFVLPGKVQLGPQGGPPRSINKLTFNIAERLDKQKGPFISEVIPFIEIGATASHKGQSKITTLIGTPSSYFEIVGFKSQKGRLFNDKDNRSSRKVVVIGQTIARDFFKNEDPIGKTISVSKKNFTVIGILEAQGNVGGIDIDNNVILPINTAKVLTGANQVNSILVRTRSSADLPQAKNQVEKILKRSLSEDDFTIFTQEQLLSTVLQILGVLTFALGGIAAISLIVGGVGISNIMLVSVTERTREIGLRKAIGAKPGDILSQFLIEAVILSVLGGLIGIMLGFLGSLALARFIQTTVPLWSVILGLGFSVIVGVIFGVAPAIRASRLEPIVALRHE